MAPSSRSRTAGALSLAAVLVALSGAPASAHRRDEYLQAVRIAIEPGRVEIEMDLTPGIAVARQLLAEIDSNRNGAIETAEGRAYAGRVLGDVVVDVDGRQLPLSLITVTLPATEAILNGEGAIRLNLTATVPGAATAGNHRLIFRNRHHADIGAYLANALVPATARVAVLSQHRDIDQRELAIDYALRGETVVASVWLAPASVAIMLMSFGAAFTRRTRRST